MIISNNNWKSHINALRLHLFTLHIGLLYLGCPLPIKLSLLEFLERHDSPPFQRMLFEHKLCVEIGLVVNIRTFAKSKQLLLEQGIDVGF